jgi:hypothetical protein
MPRRGDGFDTAELQDTELPEIPSKTLFNSIVSEGKIGQSSATIAMSDRVFTVSFGARARNPDSWSFHPIPDSLRVAA